MTKILIVEDNDMNRDMLARRLQRYGFAVCAAIDGPGGVDMATEQMPDLILMDIALGDMDGWQATRLIKADPQTSKIPVIALTAHVHDRARETSLKSGCQEFETKPVDILRLLEKIHACLAAARATARGPSFLAGH
jgi:two-component system, cell cycle response regulator DivK